MKGEASVRELLELRIKEYSATQHADYEIDVDRRLIRDLLWVLDDPRFEDW
jgi:hypothetical protein